MKQAPWASGNVTTGSGPRFWWWNELGFLAVSPAAATWMFHIVSKRYERGSIILTSNRGFGDWGLIFHEPVVATAIVDRLLHNAVVLNIRGDSYRIREYRTGQPTADLPARASEPALPLTPPVASPGLEPGPRHDGRPRP